MTGYQTINVTIISKMEKTVIDIQKIIIDNISEWEERYSEYADLILKNKSERVDSKKKFHRWKNLSTYSSIKKNAATFDLRCLGQNVAKLTINKTGDVQLLIDEKLSKTNKRNFGYDQKINTSWNSKEAGEFRKHFESKKIRNDEGKKNNEHRIENLLLNEFSKTSSKYKILTNIQPVVLFSQKMFFQMCTPLGASKFPKKYAKKGGGIDILARFKKKLCVMEVKDEHKPNESPSDVIMQAISYATFIAHLLNSKSGGSWWNIFGYSSSKIPKKIIINVVAVLPFPDYNSNIDFAKQKIEIAGTNVTLELHYMYFEEKENVISNIETSLIA